MTTIDDTESGDQGEFRGKEFDEVWPQIKDANAKVHVWKAPDGMTDSKKWGACFTFKPGEFDQSEVIEVLQAEYGPGDYPLQIKTKAKNNAPKIVWQRTLHITPRKFKPTAERELPAPTTAATDGLAVALASIAEGQRAILEALKSQPTPPAAPSTLDVAKDLAAYKELFSDNRPTPIEMFREMMEFKSLLMDENGDVGNPMTAAIRMVEKLADVAKEAQMSPPARPIVSKKPAPGTAQPPDGSETGTDNQAPAPRAQAADERDADAENIEPTALEVDAAFEFFARTYLPAAMHLYTSNQQPASVADWLVRHMHGAAEPTRHIGLVISDDQMVQRLAGFNSGVMDAAPWFDAVADSLAFALWPDDNPEPAPFDATKNATTDEKTDTGSIIDADPKAKPDQEPPDAPNAVDTKSHEDLISDADRLDPPGTGDDHDA